jgi:DNA mismatch endonuclease (patch repair protein)
LADIVDAATRSRMMAGIRGSNTKPEKLLRSALHRRGFRFRLQAKDLPGRPDIVLPRYRAAVFVHGCFWHGHDCPLFRLPRTREDFWKAKISRNRERDAEVRHAVLESGWRHLSIWECAFRGQGDGAVDMTADGVSAWLRGTANEGVIRGPRNSEH